MIRIAVCDDDAVVTESICEFLKTKEEQLQDETLDILAYHSGGDFLRDVELGALFHIVLMDIQMDGVNGIEVGELLRNRPNGDDIIMVYISGHDGYFEDIVKIGSFRFVKKPIDYAALDDVMTRALNQAVKYKAALDTPKLLKYKIGLDTYSVKTDKIVYMKSDLRMVELYVWDDEKEDTVYADKFYAKLDDVMLQLPDEQFIRTKQSYIINLAYADKMEKDAFILADKKQTRIPVSKNNKKGCKQAYFRHLESLT